jgi:hypothetical protein
MLKTVFKLFLLHAIILFAILNVSAFQTERNAPLDWAQLLVKNIEPENTDYLHKKGTVKWAGVDGAEGYESHTDCSGLLNALLERSYGLTATDFEQWLGVRRPLAITYHDVIESKNRFIPIDRISDVRPGDIIAIKYPPDADNSGHVMIVSEKPHRRTKDTEPVVAETEQWEIVVIDSSESGHGKADTRRRTDDSFGQGVGKGIFRLYCDRKGRFTGYSWSTFPNSEYHDQNDRPLAIGRLRLR